MDPPPDEVPLRRYLLQLPEVYGFKHEQIKEMRRDLRVTLLRELCGEYAPILFGNEQLEWRVSLPPREWLPEPDAGSHSHHGRPCALKLGRGEPTHRCLTCGLDDTCVLCKYCYNPADHEGHNVFVKISNRDDGGICDCGDSEAWTREVHCLADKGPVTQAPLPDGFVQRARRVLNVSLDFVVDILSGASLAAQNAVSEEQIELISEAARLNPTAYGCLHDLPAGVRWCLLMWDDDKRSPQDLRSDIQLATERSDEFVRMVLSQVQRTGRSTIAVSPEYLDLLVVRSKVNHFTTSIRSIRDLMREEMATEILQVALDLTKCRLDGVEPSTLTRLVGEALLGDWRPGVDSRDPAIAVEAAPPSHPEAWSLSDLVGHRIPTPADRDAVIAMTESMDAFHHSDEDDTAGAASPEADQSDPVTLYERLAQQLSENLNTDIEPKWPLGTCPSRVKYLIFYDIRLFKILRQTLTDLYVSALMSNPELKMNLALVYADLYPLLVEQYMNIDREPDFSVITVLSTQLFTTPSVATKLMHTDAFYVYCKMLRDLFVKKGKLDPAVFRNRRVAQVFHDLGYLLGRNVQKESVGGNSLRIAQTAHFLSLFQGLAPMQRQIDKHVEYENERWIYCFAHVLFPLELAHSVASCVQDCESPPVEGIRAVAAALTRWEEALQLEMGIVDKTNVPRPPIPEKDPVAMLHTVHSFLSSLIEYSTFKDLESLRHALVITDPYSLGIFDTPMRTLALLSQISVGLWVRNGYVMRLQLQYYRGATLRDLTFARDLFLTQVAFCALDPNVAFKNLMNRFGVEQWPHNAPGDEHQNVYLLEEFLHYCTSLVCDRLRFHGLRGNDLKRALLEREIVQVLGFGAMPYSEITKLVPDSMVVDELFDMILAECASFTPPRGSRGVGMYILRPQYYEKFDPQYSFFTISRTEEAERIMKKHFGNAIHTPVMHSLPGPWSRLGLFTLSWSFRSLVQNILKESARLEVAQAEQVLGRLLYLLIVAAKNDALQQENEHDEYCYDSITKLVTDPGDGVAIIMTLWEIYETPSLRALHARVKYLVELLHAADPNIQTVVETKSEIDQEAEEISRRKEKARAMQQKVLADFSRQQEEFIQRQSEFELPGTEEEEPGLETTDGYVFPKHCVLCCIPDDAESIFGIMTYTSDTRVQRDIPLEDPYWTEQAFSEDPSLDVAHPMSKPVTEQHNGSAWGPAFPREHTHVTTVVQGCGHGVHHKCYQQFLDQQQQQRSPMRSTPENIRKHEFLCPLCRGLNNCFMPVLWTTNDVDVETFLSEADDAISNMREALDDTPHSENLRGIVASGLSTLSDRFLYAIEHQDFSESLASNVRMVLLEQMLKIKEFSEDDSAQIYGLRTIYRSLGATVAQTEISMRGLQHATPFGGLVIDQMPTRTTQFLRVFAKYVSTLTGFIMSSSMQLQTEPVQLGLIPISADFDFTKMLELFIFGSSVYGLQPINVLRAGLVSEFIRVFVTIEKLDMSHMGSDALTKLPAVQPELAAEISKWTNRDPRLVYAVLRYQATVFLRRVSILVFAFCGRYDPDDYAGMMNLPEHDRLLSYLQLPALETFVTNLGRETPEGYAARKFAMEVYSKKQLNYRLEYPGVYRLLQLPNRLDTMFHLPGKMVPLDPALCLFCGQMCSTQEIDEGDSSGPCNEHIRHCTGSEGIFLLPRRNCVLLLLPDDRGSFVPAPYLDLHGEPDEQMRRGRPHYLQPLRYDALAREIWLKNELPSTIVRLLDQAPDNGGWETL